jgi:hypothetical protein
MSKSNIELKLLSEFVDLKFEAKRHIYKVNDVVLPSVSILVKKHSEPFDEMFWASKVAKKKNTTISPPDRNIKNMGDVQSWLPVLLSGS